MVKKDDKKGLASSIIQLLDNKEIWQMKSNGAIDNAALYKVDKIQNEYHDYIEKVLSQRK